MSRMLIRDEGLLCGQYSLLLIRNPVRLYRVFYCHQIILLVKANLSLKQAAAPGPPWQQQ